MGDTFKRTVICLMGLLVVAGCAAYATNMRSMGDSGGAERSLSSSMGDITKQVALPPDVMDSGKWVSQNPISWEEHDGIAFMVDQDEVDIANGDYYSDPLHTSPLYDNIIHYGGGATFNEQSNDSDFRIESDSNAYMFFLDAGNDRIGVNTSAPAALLQVNTSGSSLLSAGYADLVVRDSATTTNVAGIQIAGGSTGSSEIVFAAENDASNASISCDNSGDDLTIAAEDDIVVNATGDVIVNDAGVDSDFRIEGQNDNNILYVDAGNDRMGISTATPICTLDIEGTVAYTSSQTISSSSTTDIYSYCNVVYLNTRSNAVTARLPTADGVTGKIIIVVNLTDSFNGSVIYPTDEDLNGGSETVTMTEAGATQFISGGSYGWFSM